MRAQQNRKNRIKEHVIIPLGILLLKAFSFTNWLKTTRRHNGRKTKSISVTYALLTQ